MTASNPPPAPLPSDPARVIDEVAKALDRLRFGRIEICVHDGRVVHIERWQRTRQTLDEAVQGPA